MRLRPRFDPQVRTVVREHPFDDPSAASKRGVDRSRSATLGAEAAAAARNTAAVVAATGACTASLLASIASSSPRCIYCS